VRNRSITVVAAALNRVHSPDRTSSSRHRILTLDRQLVERSHSQ
jgi:hypothetical protein